MNHTKQDTLGFADFMTLSALLPLCEENPPITVGSPRKGPVMWRFGILFDVNLNKMFNNSWITGHLRRHDAHVVWKW